VRAEDSAPCVLVVDDEIGVRELMCRWLRAVGFSVKAASSAQDALEAIEQGPPAVALCDISMPGRDGLWLAERIRTDYPDTAIIVATALPDLDPAIRNLGRGVVDYLTKPFGRARLQEAVSRGVEWHRTSRESRQWRDTLEQEVHERHERLTSAVAAMDIDSDEALDRMLSALTLRGGDREAYAHAYRVAALAGAIARAMDIDEADVAVIERGALLHDLGKLAMPEALLRKPAPLTVYEHALIRMHPAIASSLLGRIPFLAAAATIVRDAHERPDGRGFPQGSSGDNVSMAARIVTVADAFDTMIRPRVFREALTPSEALEELDLGSGTQFDRRIVDVFKRINA
jgi:putative nucleotidyltransferase with HDIG domain